MAPSSIPRNIKEDDMGEKIGKRSNLVWGVVAGFALGLVVLMTGCGSGEAWTEVQSFSTEDKTISAGKIFRLEPAAKDKNLIENAGATFEAKFNCTRLEGTGEVAYKAASSFESEASRGGFGVKQSIVDQDVRKWPEGANSQAVAIGLPFFPWEAGSGKEGVVYFYLIDADDGSVLSNIIQAGIKVKAGK
jgi:hypothetical protein